MSDSTKRNNHTKRVVVVFSGGLDSTTLLYHLRAEGFEFVALAANYGQRHLFREVAAAESICKELGLELHRIDLTALASAFGQNALTDHSLAVPDGAYSEETLVATTVPNRNMVLISVGLAYSASKGYGGVALGVHSGENTNYPDCKPGFAEAMDLAARECNDPPLSVLAPFVRWDKAAIVRRGAELGVPFGLTWSCYKGGDLHCGTCGTCHDRREAFSRAQVNDPTRYAN